MSVRKRPVITVVEARPMDQVGFRDTKAAAPVLPEAQRTAPMMPKHPPVARPVPPSNINNTSTQPNPMPITRHKPVPVERKPSELISGLDLDDQMKKFHNPPPPKPRRIVPVRPITIHFDGQNNIITDEQKSFSGNPIPMKRPSVHANELSNNNDSQNSHISANTNDSWKKNDWVLEESTTKSKPEAAPRRPTIIRASTYKSKGNDNSGPLPVVPKGSEVKQHSAEPVHSTDAIDTTVASSYAKPAAKPKPMVKIKPESKSEIEETESRLDQQPDVRKRPTVIRPLLDRNSKLPGHAASQNIDSTEKDAAVEIPVHARVAPTIIHPGLSGHASTESYSKNPVNQNETVCDLFEQTLPVESVTNEQTKTRPNIIRPNFETSRKDHLAESSVSISSDGNTVRFLTSEAGGQPEELRTGALIDASETQNAENWKRVEMEESRSKAPARPSVQPVQEPFKKPPSKPPPPRSNKVFAQGSTDIPIDTSQQSTETHSHQGPPPRPSVGPMKASKPAQPSKGNQFSAGLGPSLPRRPTQGHPLFHYVVTGPHAIALFEYQSTQADELYFRAGEVIVLEKWVNSEWLYGRTAIASGMFPATFVDIIQPPLHDTTDSQMVPASVPVTEHFPAAPLPGSGPRCLARFDYNGEDPSDLAFVEGDVIQILERIGDEWIKGELNQRKGMFPISFVEIIEDLSPLDDRSVPSLSHSDESSNVNDFLDQQPGEHNPLIEPHCIALYDFPAQNPDDLSFSAGDKIILLSRINDDWLEGKIRDKTGVFPSSFVQIVQDLVCHDIPTHPQMLHIDPIPSVEPSQSSTTDAATAARDICVETSSKAIKTAVAVYDFPGETPDDLTFHIGDVVEIIGTVNNEWMEGKINGKSGIFPSAFVKLE